MSEVLVCPSCRAENPPRAKFCMECAAPLAAPRPRPAEERKVVSILFCDLVGFTAMSEAADPEDVEAVLGRYHEVARREIEHHGGVVEKYIGDAVVGVFGVPAVHEDDPERAVRAGLRVLRSLAGITRPDGTPLEARVGVNTGEALVRLDVDPASGRGFLTGDAVNTAARLQAAAAPMTVLIGEATRALTDGQFVLEGPEEIAVKGKRDRLTVWRALAPVSFAGTRVSPGALSPFTGREEDVATLTALFESACSSGTPRFVSIVGEPGIGKTRLVHELLAYVDARPGLTTWRQGRCPPYGEGVSFWALAEIVRAQCGIVEATDVEAARARLEDAVAEGPDHDWLVERLGALLGVPAPSASLPESFAAWSRFLESLAVSHPAVVVVEDLHWADEALLEFLGHLRARATSVPLVVVATSRPEASRRRPSIGAEDGGVEVLTLRPLSHSQTATLIGSIAAGSAAVGAATEDIVERSGGNPLFVEECVRLLSATADVSAVPASLGAVIAARLDRLGRDEKALLADAAVVGTVFWDGALRALGSRESGETDRLLRALMAQRLVRCSTVSTLPGEREFAFAHALTREVAYRQLPRTSRAHKHAAVARWLGAEVDDRRGELADVLAYHYSTALELATAVRDPGTAGELTDPARRALVAAGDRAADIDLQAARRHYEAALDLTPADDPGRGDIESKLGEALLWSGQVREAAQHLTMAADLLRAAGDRRRAAIALARLARAQHTLLSDSQERELYEEAVELLADDPCDELVTVLTELGRQLGNVGHRERSLDLLQGALDVAASLGLPVPPLALNLRGIERMEMGDPACLDDFRESLRLAEEQGLVVVRERVWGNYASLLTVTEGPRRALEEYEKEFAFGVSHGLVESVTFGRVNRLDPLVAGGHWDEALREAEVLRLDDSVIDREWTRLMVVMPLVWRGDLDTASEMLAQVGTAGCRYQDDVVLAKLGAATLAAAADLGRAAALLWELLGAHPPGEDAGEIDIAWLYSLVPDAGRMAVAAGDVALADAIRRRAGGEFRGNQLATETLDAQVSEAEGELESAAAGFSAAAADWHDFGVPYEEGHAHFGRGRCLMALGRAPEAAAPLAAARELFARLGAKPALAETEEWLVRALGGPSGATG